MATMRSRLIGVVALLLSTACSGSDSLGSPVWPLKVKLKKVFAANVSKLANDAASTPPSFYVGRLSLGEGAAAQEMLVTFDTSSGNVLLFGSTCRSPSCRAHRQYDAKQSTTAMDINTTGHPVVHEAGDRQQGTAPTAREQVLVGLSSLELGDGEIISNPLRELLCVGSGGAVSGQGRRVCLESGVLVAQQVSHYPFLTFPHDGIVGLSLNTLSTSPVFNFVEQFFSQADLVDVPSQFGMFYGSKGGEIALGGYDASRLDSSLQWVPVAHAEDGYWQVRILEFKVGNMSLGNCGENNCHGIVDTSASTMGMPPSVGGAVKEALRGTSSGRPGTAGLCGGPTVSFTLEGGVHVALNPGDYLGDDSVCAFKVNTFDIPAELGFPSHLFLLGEPFLRRYYTVFDWAEKRLGVGLAAKEAAGDELFEQEVDLNVAASTVAVAALIENLQAEADPHADVGVLRRAYYLSCSQLFRYFALVLVVASTFRVAVVDQSPWAQVKCKILGGHPALADVMSLMEPVCAREAPNGDECPVCLGSCEEADLGDASCDGDSGGCGKRAAPRWCRLHCGHKFHEDCIFQWLRRANQCPVCRRQIWADRS